MRSVSELLKDPQARKEYEEWFALTVIPGARRVLLSRKSHVMHFLCRIAFECVCIIRSEHVGSA